MLTIDPGLMTGLSFIDMRDADNPAQVWSDELDVVDFRNRCEEVIRDYGPNVLVVIENFIISESTARKTSAPWSLKGIGVIEWFCYKYGAKLVVQQPSDIGELTSADLKAANFWHVSKIGAVHGRDALMHAVVYLKNTNRRWARRFL